MPAPVYTEQPSSDVRTRQWGKREQREHESAQASSQASSQEQQFVMHTAVVGMPNAGKSLLHFRLTGSAVPVSAISAKANTTRESVLAVDTHFSSGVQLLYHDTPGFGGTVQTRRGRKQVVEHSVASGATTTVAGDGAGGGAVDVSLLVVDAVRNMPEGGAVEMSVRRMLEATAEVGVPTVLVLNKVDLLKDKRQLLPMAERLLQWVERAEVACGVAPAAGRGKNLALFRELDDADDAWLDVEEVVGAAEAAEAAEAAALREGVSAAEAPDEALLLEEAVVPEVSLADMGLLQCYFVSSESGDGVNDLRDALRVAARDPAHAERCARPWVFPAGVEAEISQLERAEELIREQVFVRMHQELPYQVKQVTLGWTDQEDGSLRIDHEFRVPRTAQRNLLLGRKSYAGARHGTNGVNHALAIARAARPRLQVLLGRKVELHITVKSMQK